MLIQNLFEFILIGLAVTYSGFARLPILVAANIIVFTLISMILEKYFVLDLSPGYEIYYSVGGIYFIAMSYIFHTHRNLLYNAIAIVMLIQAIASGSMLISDSVWRWHEFINDKSVVVEAICVWLSTMYCKNGESRE